ncbi:hypothetical protein, partial [Candidatus Methylacidithermus pantelleriae]|uniref:hypothetical protein n=1 Tax=Candidatus Methylacidithermus pantelleriae TaxID=2744239 RepID=UPI001BD5F2A5
MRRRYRKAEEAECSILNAPKYGPAREGFGQLYRSFSSGRDPDAGESLTELPLSSDVSDCRR